jgi:hypothetical protein
MSVTYTACASDECYEVASDHGDGTSECTNCETTFCSVSCGLVKKQETPKNEGYYYRSTCKFCRFEVAKNHELLDYLFKSFGLTREQIEKEFLTKKELDGQT